MAGTLPSNPGGRAPLRPPPRPDPQPAARYRLNVIEQITAGAVASDYADAVAEPAPSSRRQRVVVAALSLGVAGFILALGMSARVLNAPAVDEQKRVLLERIDQAEDVQGGLTEEVSGLREEAEAARAAQLESALGGVALSRSIEMHELATGYVAVTGPATVVTLTDAPPGPDGTAEDVERVLDADVQSAVNGLWSAGAEAIAVNGQRLSARSAIRSAAGAILVNYRPLQPPYRIEAIGDPESLEDRFLASQDAAELRAVAERYGIGFATETVDEVRLPASTLALPETAEVIGPGKGDSQ